MIKGPPALKRAVAGLGILALVYLLAWASVPALLKWQAEKAAASWLGRDVRIGHVTFTPWNLDLVADDITVASAAPSTPSDPNRAGTHAPPSLTVGRIHLDLAWASLWERAPVFQAVDIDALRVHVTRLAPGRYDIDDVLGRLVRKPDNEASAPFRFALYNVQISDSAVEFDDRPASRVHKLSGVHLAVPMLSNLPAQIGIKVEPRLSFVLNGVPFDSGALAMPFAATRSGELTLKMAGLDLAPYLGYLPDSWPLRIKAGKLSTDLTLTFAIPPGAAPTVDVHGRLAAADTELVDRQGAPLLSWRRLELDVRSVAPLTRRVSISSLRVEGARLAARRTANGQIDLLQLAAGDRSTKPAPERPSLSTSAVAPGVVPVPAQWQVGLERFSIADSAATWHDAAVEPAASLRMDHLTGDATRIEWPLKVPVVFTAAGSIRSDAGPDTGGGSFSVEGTASALETRLKLALDSLPLESMDAYLGQSLAPRVSGRLSAQARVDWSGAASTGAGPQLIVDSATVDALKLREREVRADRGAAPELASLARLSVTDAHVDLAEHAVTVGRVSVERPSLSFARLADGRFDIERWRVPPKSSDPSLPATVSADVPWRILLRDAVMTDGRFNFADARPAGTKPSPPLRFAVDNLRIATRNLAWQGGLPTVPAQIELSGRVGPPRAPGEGGSRVAGSLEWRGVLGVSPMLAIGSLRVERLPLHLLMPYADLDLGLHLAHAEFGYVGNLSMKQLPQGLDVDAGADVLVGAVRIEAASAAEVGDTLLSWNTLGFKGLRFSVKPGAKPTVDIAQAALDDFYTRLVITEDGKLNLSAINKPSAPAAATVAAKAGLPFEFRLDETRLTNGRVDFSDHFVRPNYSAALTEMTGTLGAFRSDSPDMAALSLHGKAAGTALLDITGHVNPIARPLALDLRAKATDLELAPLSPYAGKYAGYAIERGKLSMEASYRLGADGRLDARNQFTLHQLTFGKKIESPTATKLPVLLAVALLKDRNGAIDLDLPISGSVSDPQFSVGGIIARLLGNLLVKAIASPFALLTGGAGRGDLGADPGQIEFLPGTARLAPAGVLAVDKVVAGLVGKPTLALTITGTADPQSEPGAYRSAVLDDRLEAMRRKQTVASAAAASAAAPSPGTNARSRLLKDLYADSDLPDKPRNLLGFAKEIPDADMEARLKAAIPVDADTMRALALQRGVGVRDALIAKGLTGNRLFLAAPALVEADAATAPAPAPAVKLTLSLD